jgi:hypothetical protein
MAKWVIEAPRWEASGSYVHANTRLGSIWQREDYPGFLASVYCGKALTVPFENEAEARAWVEARVIKAMGATPHDPDAEWNAAIEAAACLVEPSPDLSPPRRSAVAVVRSVDRSAGD